MKTASALSRRRFLATAATTLIASTTQAHSEQRVTVDVGFYTLNEVVQLLSVLGDRGRCYPTLEGRGVLLCLKNRKLVEVRQALCETLGVTIEPLQGRFQWEIKPDKTVEEREEQWRKAYAAHGEAELDAYVKRVEKHIEKHSFSKWVTETNALREKGMLLTQDGKASEEWHRLAFASQLTDPNFWLAIRRFHRRLPDLRRTILASARPASGNDGVRTQAFSTKFPVDGVPEEHFAITAFAEHHDTLAERLSFDPLSQRLVFEMSTFFPLVSRSLGSNFAFPCGFANPDALFACLGEDALAYFTRSSRRTEAFFAAAETTLPALNQWIPRLTEAHDSFSSLLLAWSRATGAEMIAEIEPLRDTMMGMVGGHRWRLADLNPTVLRKRREEEIKRSKKEGGFLQFWGGFLSDTDDAKSDYPPALYKLEARQAMRESIENWEFHQDESGLVLINNRLGFLDHLYNLSLDLPIALWRQREANQRKDAASPRKDAYNLPSRPALAPFDLSETLQMLLSPSGWNLTGWVRLNIRTFWDFPLHDMARAVPFLHLLARLPAFPNGESVWEAVLRRGRLMLPVSACGADAGQWLADALRRQGFWCPNAYHPRFAEAAGQGHFVLEVSAEGKPVDEDEERQKHLPTVHQLSLDLQDLTRFGTRPQWDINEPRLEGYWFFSRTEVPTLRWSKAGQQDKGES